MLKNYNRPYVKRFDENGNITNPINGFYPTNSLNRRQRRQKHGKRKINCKKGGPWQTIIMVKDSDVNPVLNRKKIFNFRTKFICHDLRTV